MRFSSRSTAPPPVAIITPLFRQSSRSTSDSISRNRASPYFSMISPARIPQRSYISMSVSKNFLPVRADHVLASEYPPRLVCLRAEHAKSAAGVYPAVGSLEDKAGAQRIVDQVEKRRRGRERVQRNRRFGFMGIHPDRRSVYDYIRVRVARQIRVVVIAAARDHGDARRTDLLRRNRG